MEPYDSPVQNGRYSLRPPAGSPQHKSDGAVQRIIRYLSIVVVLAFLPYVLVAVVLILEGRAASGEFLFGRGELLGLANGLALDTVHEITGRRSRHRPIFSAFLMIASLLIMIVSVLVGAMLYFLSEVEDGVDPTRLTTSSAVTFVCSVALGIFARLLPKE